MAVRKQSKKFKKIDQKISLDPRQISQNIRRFDPFCL